VLTILELVLAADLDPFPPPRHYWAKEISESSIWATNVGRDYFERPGLKGNSPICPLKLKYGQLDSGTGADIIVPEMVPEFIVPDLTDFKLKPYVSYRAGETYQEALTPEDLWQYVYFNKLDKDFKLGQLDEQGNPKAPSPEEEMTPDEAWTLARRTGSDIFSERIPRQWECLEIDVQEWKKERLAKHGFEFYHDFMKEPYSPEMLLEENKDDEDAVESPKFVSPSAGPRIPKVDKKGKPITGRR